MLHAYRITGPYGFPQQWHVVMAKSDLAARVQGMNLWRIPLKDVHAFYLFSRQS